MATTTIKAQLRECRCGTLTKDANCPDCDAAAYPLWTVHTTSGSVVGYVAGFSESEALESIDQSPMFDRYLALQPRPCYNHPADGPLPD